MPVYVVATHVWGPNPTVGRGFLRFFANIDPAPPLTYLENVSKLEIITLPDKSLRTRSAPVERVDDELRRLMDDMLETMYEAPGIGLAGIQVGVPRRVITVDVAKREDENADPDPLFLINPEILWTSDERAIHEEGCLSIPEYYAEVERPAAVRVRYLDRDGRLQEIEANNILAVCLQHEIDHLNGTLFIDHLSKLKRDMVIKKFSKQARIGPKPPAL
jgi:peptide deformylase